MTTDSGSDTQQTETDPPGDADRPSTQGTPAEHPAGEEQARENAETEPPA